MHVCLFDIDGTLIQTGGAGGAALLDALCQEFGLESLRGSVSFSGRTDRGIVHDLFQLHDIPSTDENWLRLRKRYLEMLPVNISARQGSILNGVSNLLDALAERGDVTLGLLTGNIQEGARIKLAHFDLLRRFDFGGFGDDHFDRNGVAREALAAATKQLQREAARDRLWVIGDTPLDIACARHIGARVVAVGTGDYSANELLAHEPDLAVEDLSDTQQLLSLWKQ